MITSSARIIDSGIPAQVVRSSSWYGSGESSHSGRLVAGEMCGVRRVLQVHTATGALRIGEWLPNVIRAAGKSDR